MVAAEHQRDDVPGRPVHQQGLDALRGAHAQLCAQLCDGARVGRGDFGQRLAGRAARRAWRQSGRGFQIGCVIVAIGERNRILAGFGQHVKFLRGAAADAAAVGLHGAKFQTHAGENTRVSLEHQPIAFSQARLVDVKGIRILHEKFAGTHHAEARANFIAEFGLNLIEIDRQLFVAAQFPPCDVGNDFLVCRAVGEFAIVAVLEAQQFRTVLGPAARLLP